ncbi:unnamed protein product [Brugia timori]|uniref:Uncharacterized protein n=1 Tax=Brugia timori TaxID=42155 RepID=A0A3P7VQ63_9BILA|nr:unnamed protein product [Brugia timori]
MARIHSIINEKSYSERAQKIFESTAERLVKYPFILTKRINALQRHVRSVIVVGSRSNEITKYMLSLISKRFDCMGILIPLDPEKDSWLPNVDDHLKLLATSTVLPLSTSVKISSARCHLDELNVRGKDKRLISVSLRKYSRVLHKGKKIEKLNSEVDVFDDLLFTYFTDLSDKFNFQHSADGAAQLERSMVQIYCSSNNIGCKLTA